MRDRPHRVLLVEDSPRDAQLLHLQLENLPDSMRPQFVCAQNIAEARLQLVAEPCDCVLLDLGLPDASGVDAVRAIREASPRMPIVVMTGLNDDRSASAALRSGAQEYLVKGQFNAQALLHVLDYAIERNDATNSVDDGDADSRPGAGNDALTGLPNRFLLIDRAERVLRNAANRRERLAVLVMNLDGFARINDCHGRSTGDAVLQKVGEAFRRAVRGSDTVARIGGDEFAAVLGNSPDLETAQMVAQRMIQGVRELSEVHGHALEIGVSIGIALYPDHAITVEKLFASADIAMYAAKRAASGEQRVACA